MMISHEFVGGASQHSSFFKQVLCPWLISGVRPPTLHRWGFVAVVSAKMTQVCVGLDSSFFSVVSVGNLVIQPCSCRLRCWLPKIPRWWPSWSLKKGSMSRRRVNFPTLEMGENVSRCRCPKANFLAFLGHQNRRWLFSSWHCYIF